MGRAVRWEWKDAVADSDLPAPTRHVAWVLVDEIRGADGIEVQVSRARVVRRSGLSTSTVERCLRDLRRMGWVEQVAPGGGRVSATYRISYPQGRHSDDPYKNQLPTKTNLLLSVAGGADPASVLSQVVEEGLPATLKGQIARSTLLHECERLADLGWTGADLAAAMAAKGWSGAGGGAAVTWLRDLHTPPAPPRRAPECSACSGSGWKGEDDLGRPIRCSCRQAAC